MCSSLKCSVLALISQFNTTSCECECKDDPQVSVGERVHGSIRGCMVQPEGCRVQPEGCMVQPEGCRVQAKKYFCLFLVNPEMTY